ncbi:NAD(P)-dependent oxidoreductase [Cellulomonas aerilata]|uniref:3-hydroxyisobutyrate dehydrogenase n=1 Tax=Cellulomonas aerilata TaxID=515326 RepID=A0A512DCQ9_9CELL|nr:NAD(P)-dependent oxidoreductase [Cellulomonas aerilata]GEO34264.1 3-hydroxyisobutyrate dehydrogenase [Cellulomonas aerilata]
MPAPTTVAVLGTGALGHAMAVRLADRELTVRVWNRTPQRAAAVVAERGQVAAHEQVADAVAGADVVLTVVRDDAALESLADAVLAAMPPGGVWVQASTIGPDAARRSARRAAEAGVAYVDAPVSGSTVPARSGTLVWLVAGASSAIDAARPVLDALGSSVQVLGAEGWEGSAAKLVVNAWMASAVVAAADALALADRLGVGHDALRDVLGAGALAMPYALAKMQAMDAGSHEPGFAVELALKDLRLAARDAAFSTPLLDAVAARFVAAEAAGHGGRDVAAVHLVSAPPAAEGSGG